jgi:hypothetical protein
MGLTKIRIRAGLWEGVLTGLSARPDVQVLLLEKPIADVQVQPVPERPGDWSLRVPIPVAALNDGVQTFVIQDKPSGETLGHFTIVTGVALEDDLRAEIDLLRAELDMLKRAFRRHCVETA